MGFGGGLKPGIGSRGLRLSGSMGTFTRPRESWRAFAPRALCSHRVVEAKARIVLHDEDAASGRTAREAESRRALGLLASKLESWELLKQARIRCSVACRASRGHDGTEDGARRGGSKECPSNLEGST